MQMLKNILQMASQYTKAAIAGAIQNSGIGALYLGTSTLLAAMLLAAYLSYAWSITPERWYRAYAILYGADIAAIQQAEKDAAAEARHEEIVAQRALRTLDADYIRNTMQQRETFKLPPPVPPPVLPPPPTAEEMYAAYQKRIDAELAKIQMEGLDEAIRSYENMDPDAAKDILMQHWKDGKTKLVLDIFNGMDDKRKDKIYDAFRTTDDEELKILNEIMQKIGDGEPKTSLIENAAKKPS
jgi:hypothetical protein